ncbi:molybdopterin-guanine dinucleotide biosynthesis protein B [Phreatobacter cathodiphilus]|uniref:Molybdopterin-guanine dinucleotide biosynthesis protein B n=1 Tax=Phreatobacter cathodiphilus TaxID=1868589 RepID=A0A2S0NGE2_9HYPH|nr:molybdopterin-guanine dinucleotide biosynthesis protein B [Phreatobacter cathodiphilus]AVO47001.1 molybdopterin-guanine dinucleotide biosynthesis protein B [Phreatobacter cathodiphilus]
MKVVGLAGWSGAGKTTLLARVIPVLTGRGLAVSTVKHAHHAFDIDQPGKDSHAHREAGAREVLVASGRRWALMHELRDEEEPRLADLLARLSPVDLVIVEGFKREAHPKVEIHRAANGKPWLFPDVSHVRGLICDAEPPGWTGPRVGLDDAEAAAGLLAAAAEPLAEVVGRLRASAPIELARQPRKSARAS